MVREAGLDLRCGGGRVAALTCPRHVIHSRSRSSPHQNKNRQPPLWDDCLFLVREAGLEVLFFTLLFF